MNALDMAITQRRVTKGSVVHADHGVPFTSWSFTERIRDAGLTPSFGSIGGAFDDSMMESFWSSVQNELLNRRKCKTRLELTNAIVDYVEVFYNRQRRHSSLDSVSPVEFELAMKEHRPPEFKTGMGKKAQRRSESPEYLDRVSDTLRSSMTTWSRCLTDEFEANVRQRRKDCVKDSYFDPVRRPENVPQSRYGKMFAMSKAVTRQSRGQRILGNVFVLTFYAILSLDFSGIASGAPKPVIKPPVISDGTSTKLPCTKRDQSTIGLIGCYEKHAREIDRRINAEVALIFTLLDTGEKSSFVKAENAWLDYRNSDCESVASLFQGGTIAPVEYGSCVVNDDLQYSRHLHGFFQLLIEGRSSVPHWP